VIGNRRSGPPIGSVPLPLPPQGGDQLIQLVRDLLHLPLRRGISDDEAKNGDAVCVVAGAADRGIELGGGHLPRRVLRSGRSIVALRTLGTGRPAGITRCEKTQAETAGAGQILYAGQASSARPSDSPAGRDAAENDHRTIFLRGSAK
jgi:hypothetical protein